MKFWGELAPHRLTWARSRLFCLAASTGLVGDAYDNTLMESVIGLFKSELIRPRRPRKTPSEVELATAE
ncbi:hypothetical protein [Streptomyces zagrosensis]|uniref:Transposase n=1 Tax=Streptomyces zagrosensis TaxID=1042984 RepID=A0A7W9Q3W4_9ACTN|nr:hypothetical protein [Streptomyces zagrosensis]MBB5933125.1 hypothetical protein [Streptomyces zagrosensis]